MKESLKRLLEWVESHGGPQVVGPRIGKSAQSFYNYRNRGSMPNMEIFELLATQFEDFDPRYILTGKSQAIEKKRTEQIEDVLSELNELRQEASLKDAIIKKLVGKIEVSLLSPEQYKRMNQKHQGISVFAKAHGLSGVRPRQAFFVVKR